MTPKEGEESVSLFVVVLRGLAQNTRWQGEEKGGRRRMNAGTETPRNFSLLRPEGARHSFRENNDALNKDCLNALPARLKQVRSSIRLLKHMKL